MICLKKIKATETDLGFELCVFGKRAIVLPFFYIIHAFFIPFLVPELHNI